MKTSLNAQEFSLIERKSSVFRLKDLTKRLRKEYKNSLKTKENHSRSGKYGSISFKSAKEYGTFTKQELFIWISNLTIF